MYLPTLVPAASFPDRSAGRGGGSTLRRPPTRRPADGDTPRGAARRPARRRRRRTAPSRSGTPPPGRPEGDSSWSAHGNDCNVIVSDREGSVTGEFPSRKALAGSHDDFSGRVV